jgi:hypothetical protein
LFHGHGGDDRRDGILGSSRRLQERSLPSPAPLQPASNPERSTSAGRNFGGVPAFLLHCKNLFVLISSASFFLSFLLPILSTNHHTGSVASVLATGFNNHGSLSQTFVARKKERKKEGRGHAQLCL